MINFPKIKNIENLNSINGYDFHFFLTPQEIQDYKSATPTVDFTSKLNSALQTISTNGGGILFLQPCKKLIVSDTIICPENMKINGSGTGSTIIFCTQDFSQSDDVIQLNGNNCYISNLSIKGNTNGTTGGGRGIHFINGIGCGYENVYIENTTNAGIWIENQTNFSGKKSTLYRTGRTGYAENHGIMITARNSYASFNINLSEDIITNAWRKGITTYTDTGGTITDLKIDKARILACGLGGFFIGGIVSGTTTHNAVKVTNSYVYNSYVNYEFAGVNGLTLSNNTGSGTLTNYGQQAGSGDANMILDGISSSIIDMNILGQSETTGIDFRNAVGNSSFVTLTKNIIQDSNRSNIGYAPHINLSSVTNSKILKNTCFDTATAKSTHGIYENTNSDNNEFGSNLSTNVVNEKLFITGINSKVLNKSLNEIVFAISNGQSNNLVIPKTHGILHINAPTAAYSISGIVGSHGGDQVTLLNYTTQTLTLIHNSSASSSNNRLFLPSSANLTVAPFSSVTLKYTTLSSGEGIWYKI